MMVIVQHPMGGSVSRRRGPSRPRRHEVAYRAAEARLWASLGVAPDDRFVPLARLGARVRVQSVGDGAPVVLLHGATTSGSSWADLAAALPGVRCHLVDRPGTGLSPPLARAVAQPSDVAAIADVFLADLLDGLELAGTDLVATSFGGYFALRGLRGAGPRVRRVVMFGWTTGAPLGRMPLAMRLGALPGLGSLMARLPVNDRAVRLMFRGIGLREAIAAGRVSDEAIGAYAALINHTPTLRNELALSRAILSPVRGLDERLILTEAERRSIATPILFLWGDRDPFGGPALGRAFVEPFPNATLEIIPGAGHAVWMDDVGLASQRVRAFLR